jgi:hypothetical protein
VLERLRDLNEFWVAALFGSSVVVCFLLGPRIGSRLGLTVPNKDRGDYVARAQMTIISFTAMILAFSLVQAQNIAVSPRPLVKVFTVMQQRN